MRQLAAVVAMMMIVGCGDGAESGAQVEARAYLEATFDGDTEAIWDTLPPEMQAATTRAEYTACLIEGGFGSNPAGYRVDIDVGDEYVEGGATFVDATATETTTGASRRALLELVETPDGWFVIGVDSGGDGESCIPGADEIRAELVDRYGST